VRPFKVHEAPIKGVPLREILERWKYLTERSIMHEPKITFLNPALRDFASLNFEP
jgi:hypothetical protein